MIAVARPDDVLDAAAVSAAVDESPALWLSNSLQWAYVVGSVVGAGWADYARVFHPAWRAIEGGPTPVSWAEVARAYRRQMHPAAEWGSLIGRRHEYSAESDRPEVWGVDPAVGVLPLVVARPLASVLAEHTTTADRIWYASWAGTGGVRRAPSFEIPGRTMYLFTGPIAAVDVEVEPRGEPINMWWPDDHAWCVATDIDLRSTYVGATRACVDAILTDTRLEVLQVRADQGITWDSDTVNPRPPDRPR
jgi:hypothetical protein